MHSQMDLQATQYIIGLLENSKKQSETALDGLPGVYAIIDHQGQILKGNKSLARLFEIDHEKLLGMNINQLFSKKNWEAFISQIETLKVSYQQGLEFKIDVVTAKGIPQNYLWYLSPIQIPRKDVPALLSLVGRDVTDLTQATAQNTRMQMELNTAKMVQDTFFPPTSAAFGKSSVEGYSEAATECGGDWWHHSLRNNKIYLWLGDVTGHGVPAALVVSAVHSVVSTMSENDLSPSEALSILNRAVGATTSGTRAMTFLIASIDLKTHECRYTSAAHEPIILFPNMKKEFRMRDLQLLSAELSSPLGVDKMANYQENIIRLSSGDQLLFYTDGIYDICDPTGTVWGLSQFHRTVASLATKFRNPKDFVKGLRTSMDDYRKGTPLKDDATFFVFQV